MQSNK